MRKSVVDNYLKLISNGDSKYFGNWLKMFGNEVQILRPIDEAIENYKIAFGASTSTFERSPEYYTFYTGYVYLESLDFAKKENVHDLDLQIYLPDQQIKTGDLLQIEKVGKVFTYQIEPLDNYQNFLYRSVARLLDVVDLEKK